MHAMHISQQNNPLEREVKVKEEGVLKCHPAVPSPSILPLSFGRVNFAVN